MGRPLSIKAGQVFGSLTVVSVASERRANRYVGFATCKCTCGNVVRISNSQLVLRKRCSRRCDAIPQFDGKQHPLVNTWGNMIARCHNPKNKRFSDYGGRGIFVTSLWKASCKEFVEWGIANGWAPGLQIDRINNDGPYAPGNCRFVTPKENMAQRRNTSYLTAFGERKRIGDWLTDRRCSGVSLTALQARIQRGMAPEEAITKPPVDRSKKLGKCVMCGATFQKKGVNTRACSLACGVRLGHQVRREHLRKAKLA